MTWFRSGRAPSLSVVLPVRNGLPWLGESVRSMLEQTYGDFELLILDDGSIDATADLVADLARADHRIRQLWHAPRGLVATLNRGLAEARADLIARMDADDVSDRTRFERQLALLRSRPDVAVVGGAVRMVGADGEALGVDRVPVEHEDIVDALMERVSSLWHPTVMLRRRAVLEAGGYRPQFACAEDYDLWLRVSERHRLANLDEIVLDHRRHGRAVSFAAAERQSLSMLGAWLAARARRLGLPDPSAAVGEVGFEHLVAWGLHRTRASRIVVDRLRGNAAYARACGFEPDVEELNRAIERYDAEARLPTPRDRFRFPAANGNGRAASAPFTVVVPAFEHAAYVRDAVISALRAPLVAEVLVVDDGSTDGTRTIVAELASESGGRVRDLSRGDGNLGAAERLNQLIAEVRTPFCAVLNSDDLCIAGRFEAALEHLGRGAIELTFGNVLSIDARGRPCSVVRGPFTPFPERSVEARRCYQADDLLGSLRCYNYAISTSNLLFTRDLWSRLGGFRPYRYVHDWDFLLRAAVAGAASWVDRYFTAYRRHPRSAIFAAGTEIEAEIADMFARIEQDPPAPVATRKRLRCAER